MILKNSKDKTRNFKLLFKYENREGTYLTYQDVNSKKLYAGKKEGNVLKKVDSEEVQMLEKILERISG